MAFLVVASVRHDAVSCKVGYRCLIAIVFFFEYQKDLARKRKATVLTTSKIHSELEWHIQTVMFALLAGLASTEVMNRVPGRLN